MAISRSEMPALDSDVPEMPRSAAVQLLATEINGDGTAPRWHGCTHLVAKGSVLAYHAQNMRQRPRRPRTMRVPRRRLSCRVPSRYPHALDGCRQPGRRQCVRSPVYILRTRRSRHAQTMLNWMVCVDSRPRADRSTNCSYGISTVKNRSLNTARTLDMADEVTTGRVAEYVITGKQR